MENYYLNEQDCINNKIRKLTTSLDDKDEQKLWDILHNEIHLLIEPDMEAKEFCRNVRQYQPEAFADIHADVMRGFDGDGNVEKHF